MIDKDKYPKLYKATQDVVDTRKQWLDDAIKCQTVCEALPEEIKVMNITSTDMTGNRLSISIHDNGNNITALKILGIQGLKPHVSSFNKDNFHANGEGVLPDDCILAVHITNIPRPANCRIETKRITRTEHILVCPMNEAETEDS